MIPADLFWLAIGILFGTLASVPTALLIAAATRSQRRRYPAELVDTTPADDAEPVIVIDAPMRMIEGR